MRYQLQTIARYFDFDLDELKKNIESNYEFTVRGGVSELNNGYMNVNFKLTTDKGEKVVRIFGEYDKYSLLEMETMEFFGKKGLTAPVVKSKTGKLISDFGEYKYSVLEFLSGSVPSYSEETLYRAGKMVGEFVKAMKSLPFKVDRVDRSTVTYKRKSELIRLIEDNMDLLKKILSDEDYEILEDQNELFAGLNLPLTGIQPIHSDIYNMNLLDDGKKSYLLDFEYIGNGPRVIDSISLIGWSLISVVENESDKSRALLAKYTKSYTEGFKEFSKFGDADEAFETMIFLNIGDSIYNLEKAIKAKSNLYRGYLKHWNNVKVLKANEKEIKDLLGL